MTPSDMIRKETEHQNLTEELHHISGQLDELIRLIRDSAANKNIKSAELSPNESEVLTVKEAAEIMRISLPKMYELAKSGKVHSLAVGRRVLISRSSLMALLREGE